MFNATEIDIAKSFFILELLEGWVVFLVLVLVYGE